MSERHYFDSEEREVFTGKVDYNMTLEEMIRNGRYHNRDNEVIDNDTIFNSKNFPIKGEGVVEVELELLKFEGVRDIPSEMESLGFRPATIEELLAFGKIFPKSKRGLAIVALGSSWAPSDEVVNVGLTPKLTISTPDPNDRVVPYIVYPGSLRKLYITSFNHSGGDGWRFLAVRK